MKPLAENERVLIGQHEYIIIRCLGRGSTCVTYEVKNSLGTRHVLKEICPDRLENKLIRLMNNDCCVDIVADENALNYQSVSEQYNNAKNKYIENIKPYIEAADKKTDGTYKLSPYLVSPVEYSENKTWVVTRCDDYPIVEEYIKSCTLEEGLEMIGMLADSLCKFYDNGYYVTDLKPSNIQFINDKSIVNVKFFDIDSLFKAVELTETDAFFSYSLGYFPTGEEFTERTMVYALGVILLQICFPEFIEYLECRSKTGIVEFPINIDFDEKEEIIRHSKRYSNGKNFGDLVKSFRVRTSKGFSEDENLNEIVLDLLLELWKKSNCEAEMRITLREFENEIDTIVKCIRSECVHPAVFLLNARQKRNSDISKNVFNPQSVDELLIPEFEIIEQPKAYE